MSEYFILFATADNCGHCQGTRGNGILNDGKVLNGSVFLKKLMRFGMEVVNIHYHQMVATKSNIKDIAVMYLKDDVVIQEKYSPFQETTRLEVYQENMKDTRKIFNDFVKENKNKVSWMKFIKERVSPKLGNYLFYFPCFMIIKRKNWAQTIKDPNEELMALTNAGYTIKNKDGSLGLLKTAESINGRNVDILKLIEGLSSNKVKFEPEKREGGNEKEEEKKERKSILKKEEKKEKKKEKKVRMSDFIEYKDVIIRSYDD